jgi:hypothetical protein
VLNRVRRAEEVVVGLLVFGRWMTVEEWQGGWSKVLWAPLEVEGLKMWMPLVVVTTRTPLVRWPDLRLPSADWEAWAGEPESALMGQIEMMRSPSDTTPANATLYVPLLAGSILKVATRPDDVPTNREMEE